MTWSTGETRVGPWAMGHGPRGRGFCDGMTLIEILVVLGIIGVIVGISLPAFTGYARQLRLKTTTRQVVGLVSLARSLAIGSREDRAVVFDAERQQLSLLDTVSGEALEQRVTLPNSVSLEVQVGGRRSDETRIVFHPTGSLGGRTVSLVLSDRERSQTITVSGVTGAVTVD